MKKNGIAKLGYNFFSKGETDIYVITLAKACL